MVRLKILSRFFNLWQSHPVTTQISSMIRTSYAAPFFPIADHLAARALEADEIGDEGAAKDLWFRATAVYRIAGFPINQPSFPDRHGRQANWLI